MHNTPASLGRLIKEGETLRWDHTASDGLRLHIYIHNLIRLEVYTISRSTMAPRKSKIQKLTIVESDVSRCILIQIIFESYLHSFTNIHVYSIVIFSKHCLLFFVSILGIWRMWCYAPPPNTYSSQWTRHGVRVKRR